jgi:hypothetical protein
VSAESVGFFAVDFFLGEAVVEASVVEAPVSKAIPLTARLSVEMESIVLCRL